jgi:hypothetical protein
MWRNWGRALALPPLFFPKVNNFKILSLIVVKAIVAPARLRAPIFCRLEQIVSPSNQYCGMNYLRGL